MKIVLIILVIKFLLSLWLGGSIVLRLYVFFSCNGLEFEMFDVFWGIL